MENLDDNEDNTLLSTVNFKGEKKKDPETVQSGIYGEAVFVFIITELTIAQTVCYGRERVVSLLVGS